MRLAIPVAATKIHELKRRRVRWQHRAACPKTIGSLFWLMRSTVGAMFVFLTAVESATHGGGALSVPRRRESLSPGGALVRVSASSVRHEVRLRHGFRPVFVAGERLLSSSGG